MKNHPLDIPVHNVGRLSTSRDMRLTGYHNPDNLEIYTSREAQQALGILTSPNSNALERLDISLNMVNTIQALEDRLNELEAGIGSYDDRNPVIDEAIKEFNEYLDTEEAKED